MVRRENEGSHHVIASDALLAMTGWVTLLPSHPRAKRVAGWGRGWGVLQRTH